MDTDRDLLYDLCSVRGKLRFDHRRRETRIYVEPHAEPKPDILFYADNNSRRWDSAENTLRLLESGFYPIQQGFKGTR